MIEIVTVEHRVRRPFIRKLNPFWWFLNDFEPTPPAWYRLGRPLRLLFWSLRRRVENAGRYCLGVADCNYTVAGEWPAAETVWGMSRGPNSRDSNLDMALSARRLFWNMVVPFRGFRIRRRDGFSIGDGNR